jgi:hypothetical protein
VILFFPSVSDFGSSGVSDRVKYLRSFNKEKFNRDLKRHMDSGWDACHVTSSFRKTAFGGVTTYFCELRKKHELKHGGKKE